MKFVYLPRFYHRPTSGRDDDLIALDGQRAEDHLGRILELQRNDSSRSGGIEQDGKSLIFLFAGIDHHIVFGMHTLVVAATQDLVLVP